MVFRQISKDFSETTDYRIYSETGLTEAKIDFDDGSFRGLEYHHSRGNGQPRALFPAALRPSQGQQL